MAFEYSIIMNSEVSEMGGVNLALSEKICPPFGRHCFSRLKNWTTGQINWPFLRLRALYKNNNCTYCKTLLDPVIFSSSLNDDQPKRMDKKLGIYFATDDIQSTALGYLRFKCPSCFITCHGWDDLKLLFIYSVL